jgi:hypothetical protein
MLIFSPYSIYHIFLLIKKMVVFFSPTIYQKLFKTKYLIHLGLIYIPQQRLDTLYIVREVNFRIVARSR